MYARQNLSVVNYQTRGGHLYSSYIEHEKRFTKGTEEKWKKSYMGLSDTCLVLSSTEYIQKLQVPGYHGQNSQRIHTVLHVR